MEKFEIKSQSLNTQFEYENDDLVINGSYGSNKQETEIQSINGSAHRKPDGDGNGEYIGNFTGTLNGGEMEYSMSKMSRRNANRMWEAIDGIEENINAGGNESQEGGEA